MGEMRYA